MTREGNSISDTLWELGVTHERDSGSPTDGCHTLYYAGRSIGRYSALEVSLLLQEHGLTAPALSSHEHGGENG
jgi:hypothetical protein